MELVKGKWDDVIWFIIFHSGEWVTLERSALLSILRWKLDPYHLKFANMFLLNFTGNLYRNKVEILVDNKVNL